MAFTNVGQICDLSEMLAGQAGVNRSKIPRRLLYDLINLKGIEAARRAGILDGTATITTIANQALYEKADDILHIKEVHVDGELATKIVREDVIRLQKMIDTAETLVQGTTITWHWYIENRGVRGYLGIVDDNGNAPTTAGLDVEIHYSSFPDQIISDDSQLGIPERYFYSYAQAVAAEVMKINGALNAPLIQLYASEWERCLYDMRHDAVDAAAQPMVQIPIDITAE